MLAIAPAIARQPTTAGLDRAAQFVVMGTAVLAFLLAIGGIIGVPSRLHIIHLQHAKTTAVVQWVLFTFVMRNVGMLIVAMVVAVAAVPVRFAPRRTAADTATP